MDLHPRTTHVASQQGRAQDALHHFARDVYYCSLEYGPTDVRTSLGYFNLCKVRGAAESEAASCKRGGSKGQAPG